MKATVLNWNLARWTVIESQDPSLTVPRVDATLKAAMAAISRVCGVTFCERAFREHADIEFRFGLVTQRRSDSLVLAQCEHKAKRKVITFSSEANWGTGGWLARIFAAHKWDLRTFALHELGHALGLDHQPYEGDSIMVPSPEDVGIISRPSPRDAARLQAIYGPPLRG